MLRLMQFGSARDEVVSLLRPEILIRAGGNSLPVAFLGHGGAVAEAVERARGERPAHVVLWPDSPAELAAAADGPALECPVTVLVPDLATAGGWNGLTGGRLTVRVLPASAGEIAQTIKEELQVWPA